MRPRGGVFWPARVQRVCRRDAAEVPQARHQRGSSGNAHLTVATLEDLVRPRHADRNRRPQPKADKQEAAVSRPGVRERKRDGKQPGNLDTNGRGEEQGAVPVEPVRNRGDQEDRAEVHLLPSAIRPQDIGTDGLTIQMGANNRLICTPVNLGLIAEMITFP